MYWGFQTKKQAALPQGIVPFVFAKEYNVHPDILSTAWVFTYLLFSSFYLFLLPFAYISLNELQCYFWDANSIAHNACILHFIGDMKWLTYQESIQKPFWGRSENCKEIQAPHCKLKAQRNSGPLLMND